MTIGIAAALLRTPTQHAGPHWVVRARAQAVGQDFEIPKMRRHNGPQLTLEDSFLGHGY